MSDQVLRGLIDASTTELETTPNIKAQFGYIVLSLTFSKHFNGGIQHDTFFYSDMFQAFRRLRDYFNAGPNQALLSNDPMPDVKKNHFDGLLEEDPTIDETGVITPTAVLQCEDLSRNVKKVFPPRKRIKDGVQRGMIRLTARNKFGVFWTVWVERRHQKWWNDRQAANQAQTKSQGEQVQTEDATRSTATEAMPPQPAQAESVNEISDEMSSTIDPRLLQQPRADAQHAPAAVMSAASNDAASTIDPRLLQQPQAGIQNAPVANTSTNLNGMQTDNISLNNDVKKMIKQALTLNADYRTQLQALATAAFQELDRLNDEAGNASQ